MVVIYMTEIVRNSGGIGLYQYKLKRDGTLVSGFSGSPGQETKFIKPHLVEIAFREAEAASPIADESLISTGCVQTDDSISEFYTYNGKKFIGTPGLESIFLQNTYVTSYPQKSSLNLTNFIPIIFIIITFIALYYFMRYRI